MGSSEAMSFCYHQMLSPVGFINCADRKKPSAPRLQWRVAELKQLDEESRVPSEYPGWMFERQGEIPTQAD